MRTLDKYKLKQIEDYIIQYQKNKSNSPTYREIMKALNLSSTDVVKRYVTYLEREGIITKGNTGRIDVIPQLQVKGIVMVPLVGEIACGNPTEAIENIEEMCPLPTSVFGQGELFMLRTKGDSMIDVGIDDGDLVVIRKQCTFNEGDIVSILIDGDSTLKRIYREDRRHLRLHPENQDMDDFIVNAEDCIIQGILVSCIKSY